MQSRPNRLAILCRNQRVGRSENTGETPLNLGQESKRGVATSRPHPADARSIEIKGRHHTGQRGRQERSMPPEAKAHHVDGSCRVTGSQPVQRGSNIREDLLGGSCVFVTSTLSQIGWLISQLKAGRRTGKQGHRQSWETIGGQAIRNTSHPGIHTEHLRQHDINTVCRRFRINIVSASQRVCPPTTQTNGSIQDFDPSTP